MQAVTVEATQRKAARTIAVVDASAAVQVVRVGTARDLCTRPEVRVATRTAEIGSTTEVAVPCVRNAERTNEESRGWTERPAKG